MKKSLMPFEKCSDANLIPYFSWPNFDHSTCTAILQTYVLGVLNGGVWLYQPGRGLDSSTRVWLYGQFW